MILTFLALSWLIRLASSLATVEPGSLTVAIFLSSSPIMAWSRWLAKDCSATLGSASASSVAEELTTGAGSVSSQPEWGSQTPTPTAKAATTAKVMKLK